MQIEMDTQLSGVLGEDSVTDSACSITPAKPISLKKALIYLVIETRTGTPRVLNTSDL
jgi:hypothetical protein